MNINSLEDQCKELLNEMNSLREENKSLIEDGIIDIKRYLSHKEKKKRILWILKEPNDPYGQDWSFINKFKDKVWLNNYNCAAIPTIKRIIYTSYGILYGIKEDKEDRKSVV